MKATEWVEAFASEIGAETPSKEEIDAILDLAAVAAHASERIAAPIACWIGGGTGKSAAELNAVAERIGGSAGE
jgi:hypothetical protein